MRIDILTLFPQMFDGLLDWSIVGRARERHLVDVRLHDIRACTHDKHHVVDDYPYGGHWCRLSYSVRKVTCSIKKLLDS